MLFFDSRLVEAEAARTATAKLDAVNRLYLSPDTIYLSAAINLKERSNSLNREVSLSLSLSFWFDFHLVVLLLSC